MGLTHARPNYTRKQMQSTKFRGYVGGLWQVFKPGFTKLIKVCRFCGINNRIFYCLLGVQFLDLEVWFRHLLLQLGVPQLLEDVVGKDCNKCCKCCRNRGVTNCKLISFTVVFYIGDINIHGGSTSMIKFRKNEPSRASRHQFLQTPPLIQAHIVSIPVPTRIASMFTLGFR